MIHLLKMLISIALITLIFLAQGCLTVTINIDQGKSLITAPVEYEDEESEATTGKTYVNHEKYI